MLQRLVYQPGRGDALVADSGSDSPGAASDNSRFSRPADHSRHCQPKWTQTRGTAVVEIVSVYRYFFVICSTQNKIE